MKVIIITFFMTHYFQVQTMTDTKMYLLGAITFMVVTTSLADKQNVSHCTLSLRF